MRKLIGFVTCVLLAAACLALPAARKKAVPAAASVRLPGAAFAGMDTISPDRIRAHVKFLASDLLEGRGTGQRGGDIAAEYIATQFATYGLKPGGDNGSFLQKVPMVGVQTEPESTFSIAPDKGRATKLKLGDEYVTSNQNQQPSADLNAEIVYVGYGIVAPEYNWDDYKDADVKGKVLLMLVNEPPSDDPKLFKGKALTYYGRWTYKYEEAARKGAAAVLLVHKTDMASYGWDVVRNSWSNEQAYLRENDRPKLTAASWIQLDVARKLASDAGMDIDKMMVDARSRDFRPVSMHAKLDAHIVSKVRPFDSNNVIGILPGNNPKLKSEAVMYSAHYDHLGIVPSQSGDNIYNGANDNATGCGILLEIAHAYSVAPAKPGRTIIFASVTAEEKGLVGSEFLGKHPPMPAGKISLDLNYDDLPPLGAPEEVEVSGAERTTFYPIVQSTATDFRLSIRPDARPEAGHYYRSDHFSMARVGVPAFSINEGMKYKGHDEAWGLKQAEDFNKNHYHQPSDEYHAEMDFTGDAVMARFGFALGWKAASMSGEVGWEKGDEFAPAREKSQSGQ